MTPPIALTIAGSDSGGGAGVQADLATFATLGMHGTSVLTALTAQNTVTTTAIHVPPISFLHAQLDAVLSDLPPAATKTGMLATAAIIRVVAARAADGQFPNLIVDPVITASTGSRLLDTDALAAYAELLPHALAATPNAREAAAPTGRRVVTIADAIDAARSIASSGPQWVVVKGGRLDHGDGNSTDVIYDTATGHVSLLHLPWIDTPNTHGTGCTYAAAMTAALATGARPPVVLCEGAAFVQQALQRAAAWHLGSGAGPVAHAIDQIH